MKNTKENKVYGYARVSTKKQSIERQITNISKFNVDKIFQEKYTGTKMEGRTEFKKLLDKLEPGDTIIFDSVSRMSRNAEEGFKLYKELFEEGIELIFIKEPQVNTETYKSALNNTIELTNTDVDPILEGINQYLMKLAERQIKIALDQAEKEVKDLSERTKEGIREARKQGKQIGMKEGSKLTVKKAIQSKKDIIKYSQDFEGNLKDKEVIKLIGISRNSYYKYKKELKEEY